MGGISSINVPGVRGSLVDQSLELSGLPSQVLMPELYYSQDLTNHIAQKTKPQDSVKAILNSPEHQHDSHPNILQYFWEGLDLLWAGWGQLSLQI